MDNTLALLGFGLVATFVAAVMSNRLTASVALILVPLVFALLGGFTTEIGPMVVAGLKELAPTAAMLIFAILYFAVMMEVGLFNPIVMRVVGAVRGDPVRATVATAILALIVSLDGDGATTIMVTVTALLPIYARLRMNTLILATLIMISNMVINIAPWGGPTARAAAALKLDPADVFVPLIPAMVAGALGIIGIAYVLGLRERRRLQASALAAAEFIPVGVPNGNPAVIDEAHPVQERHFVFNLVLTLAVMVAVVMSLLPLAILFMVGFAIALLVNFPDIKAQRELLRGHALNVVNVTVLLFGAAVFTGVLSGTGMVEAMALALMKGVPDFLGPHLAPVTAIIAMPLTFFMSNDAYYFGVLPVIAQTAANYGVPMVEVARASLLGGPVHGLSPLLAAAYLLCGMVNVELGAFQRFALKWAVLVSLLMTVGALLTGAISLTH
jgi:citrate-Mg2+:H+ or citrate-Ca2+:H+ symporter, CitMHS family